MTQVIRLSIRYLTKWELAIIAVLTPFLLFPTLNLYLSAAAAAGVALVWFARWSGRGSLTRRTPLDVFILIIMAMIPVAIWASPLVEQSALAALRVLLGIALYYAMVNTIDHEHILRRTLLVAVAGGAAVALIGLVTSDWSKSKIPFLDPLYQYLPDLSHLLGPLASEQDSTPGAFHPNFIGATLAVLLPLTGALFSTTRHEVERVGIVVAALIMLGVLVLTQSRLGMVALVVASGTSLLRLFPPLRRPALALGVAIGLLVVLVGWERLFNVLTSLFASGGFGSWASRVSVWEGSFRVLSDFPFTGIGLSTFYPAATYLYPFNFSSTWVFGHTHETYLQMGVDFGWIGLFGFVAMIVTAIIQGWPGRSEAGSLVKTLRVGVWTSLLTYALFGLFDGIPMWTKPGFLIWALLAWVMIGRRLAGRSNEGAAAG